MIDKTAIGIDPALGESTGAMSLVQLSDNGEARLLYVLQDGDAWRWHPDGGVVIAHPDREPVWIRVIGDKVASTVLKP